MTAKQLRRLHLWLAVAWGTAGLGASWLLQNSLFWIDIISVYALVVSHLAAYSGARAEDS